MSEIHVLPSEVIDQIAAGEVVERPAHMIKELVENSLDAGATEIEVEFSEGGRFVKVKDNGKGISPEDLTKAIERFATSKISLSEDLWKLASFGFRGEALASISSVSRFTITSRQKNQERAARMVSQFGKKSELDFLSGEIGTQIIIEELFSNVPARLKFLKTAAAEHSQIKTTLKALALSHPNVSFRIFENSQLLFFWPECEGYRQRVEQVLEISPLYESEAQRENVKAFAVFADPHHVAKTSKNIWLFVQNRWVQDRGLQAAVMEAYRNLLMHGEFPIVCVWVTTPTDFVDVNIHPTKSQVKFQNSSLAFRAVQAALRDSLEKAPWIPKNIKKDLSSNSTDLEISYAGLSGLSAKESQSMNYTFQGSEFSRTQFQQKKLNHPSLSLKDFEKIRNQSSDFEIKESQTSESQFQSISSLNSNNMANSNKEAENHYWSSLEILGQAALTYIVCQARDKIVFVDQHAAHERVVFEKLMQTWKGGNIDIQEYLFPLAVDLSTEKVEALRQVKDEIQRLGVHLEELGPSTMGVKAAPSIIKENVFQGTLEKIADEVLNHGGSAAMEKVIGDICASMACHSVVRAGQALSHEQMRNLLIEMDEFPLSSFCPHGRPVSVEYPFYKLEKDFGRIV